MSYTSLKLSGKLKGFVVNVSFLPSSFISPSSGELPSVEDIADLLRVRLVNSPKNLVARCQFRTQMQTLLEKFRDVKKKKIEKAIANRENLAGLEN